MSARYYDIGGRKYVSVTTALSVIRKPFLETWRGEHGNEEADRIRDEAAEYGRDVHQFCHDIVKGGFAYPDPLVEAFEEWFTATVKEVIAAERVCWSDRYQYAGRFDLLAVLKGDRTKPTVADIKTSGGVWLDFGLQLAAYQEALREQGQADPKRRLVVHLDKKTGKVHTKEFSDARDFSMFLYAAELYRYFEGGKLNERNCEIVKIG